MKRAVVVLLALAVIFALVACNANTVRGSVVRESTYGNAELDIMPQKLLEEIQIGETVVVTIGDFSEEMLFSDEWIDDDGKLQLFFDRDEWCICVCSLDGDFCGSYGISAGDKVTIRKAG